MKMSMKMKYFTTFSLFACYFFYGVNYYIIGPTLIELAALFKTSIERICFIYTVRSAGYTLGSFSGFLFNHINRQLAFVFFMILMGVTLIQMPHCTSLFQLFSMGAINGFSIGSFDTAINVWILEMWGRESGPYMQALHFTYGLGSFVAPLIAEPFLSKKALIGHHMKLPEMMTNTSANAFNNSNAISNSTEFLTDEQIRSNPIMIYIPYAFAGAISVLGAFAVLALYFYKKYEPPTKEKEFNKISSNSENKDLIQKNQNDSRLKSYVKENFPPALTIWLVTMGSIFLTFFVGMEQMHLQFLPTFAVNSDLNISPSTAALMTSAAAVAFTVGRAVSIPLAIKLPPQAILYTNHAMMFLGTLILIFYANTSVPMMWVGNIILGAGFSSVYASIYAFLEQQFRVTNVIGSIFVFAGGLTCAISPSVVGKYIESNPLILIWFDLLCVVICFTILIVIHLTIYLKNREKNLKSSEIDVEIVKKVLP